MLPLADDDGLRRVRGADQWIVVGGPATARHLIRFEFDRDHRVDEAVDLDQVFALGRLDHERAGDRKRERRRVESVVDQALSDVIVRDAGGLFQRPQIEDALVRNETVLARVEHRVVVAQAGGDVVRRKHRGTRRSLEPLGAHHAHVGPRDGQNARAAVLRGTDDVRVIEVRRSRRAWQEWREMRLRRHWADAWTATAVRDAEGLVQVEVRNIPAKVAIPRVPEQGVEVGAVDVDLSPGGVHSIRDRPHLVLIHAVRARVGDHESRDRFGMRGDLRAKVVKVYIAEVVTRDDDDRHTGEHGAGRVGAVSRRWDEAHRALRIAIGEMEPSNREQPGQFALAARIGLQRHRVVAGDFGEPALELADELAVADGVFVGCERVNVCELGPGHRLHLTCRVELHRARAERDHAAVERVVLIGEVLEVAHHARLRAVRVEDRMREVDRLALQLDRQRRVAHFCG